MYYMCNAIYSEFRNYKKSKDEFKADIHDTVCV